MWSERWRVHPRDRGPLEIPGSIDRPQLLGPKPSGLWFTPTPDDWVDWCRGNQEDWLKDTALSKIEVRPDRLLRLDTVDKLLSFSSKYGADLAMGGYHMNGYQIDWIAVAAEYAGIEINPYQWDLRLDERTRWYYGWDIASGCIWDASCVRAVALVKELEG